MTLHVRERGQPELICGAHVASGAGHGRVRPTRMWRCPGPRRRSWAASERRRVARSRPAPTASGPMAAAHTLGSGRFAADGTMFVGVGDGSDGGLTIALRAQRPGQRERQDPAHQQGRHGAVGQPVLRRHELRCVRRCGCTGSVTRSASRCKPGTDRIVFGDVGWNTWEEVNHRVARAPTTAGRATRATTRSRRSRGRRDRAWRCPARRTAARSTPTTTAVGTAAIGGPFYTGDRIPAAVPGQLLLQRLLGGFHQADRVRRRTASR